MRVVHINAFDIQGGAARAAYRLHRALRQQGVDSKMLVGIKRGDDPEVFEPSGTISRAVERAKGYLEQGLVGLASNKRSWPFSANVVPSHGLIDKLRELKPDVVHLHWIAGGFLRLRELEKIEQPVLWTFHDMWGLTGGCAYALDCERYLKRCGQCPALGSKREHDLSRMGFNNRSRLFGRKRNISLVALSEWMASKMRQSPLVGHLPIHRLPNPLDTEVFRPMDRLQARELLNLDPGKKYVAFVAAGSASNHLKGMDRLIEVLRSLGDSNLELLIVGSGWNKLVVESGVPHRFLGRLHDDLTMRAAYSATDVMALPSRAETLPQSATEAQACGTAVVAFKGTGADDVVAHQITGYLSKPDDVVDFSRGIVWALNPDNVPDIRTEARRSATRKYSAEEVTASYKALYLSLLRESKG